VGQPRVCMYGVGVQASAANQAGAVQWQGVGNWAVRLQCGWWWARQVAKGRVHMKNQWQRQVLKRTQNR